MQQVWAGYNMEPGIRNLNYVLVLNKIPSYVILSYLHKNTRLTYNRIERYSSEANVFQSLESRLEVLV